MHTYTKHNKKEADSQLACTRVKLVYSIIERACIFSQKVQIEPLRNVFVDNPTTLPPENINKE